MRFGICTGAGASGSVKSAGWDFVEENVQGILQGSNPDDAWDGRARATAATLPLLAANCLVPGNLKITGPEADLGKLREYMTRVLQRAAKTGMKVLVFGSGGARNVPEGFDREKARQQIIEFMKMAAPIAGQNGVTIVAEPLNKQECNVINSVADAMTYVKAVNHPNFQCLVDSFHFWVEDEPLENLKQAMPHIRHVHLADKDGRVPPGQSGTADYRPFFRTLKQGNYNDLISVEAGGFDVDKDGAKVLQFIKRQWDEA